MPKPLIHRETKTRHVEEAAELLPPDEVIRHAAQVQAHEDAVAQPAQAETPAETPANEPSKAAVLDRAETPALPVIVTEKVGVKPAVAGASTQSAEIAGDSVPLQTLEELELRATVSRVEMLAEPEHLPADDSQAVNRNDALTDLPELAALDEAGPEPLESLDLDYVEELLLEARLAPALAEGTANTADGFWLTEAASSPEMTDSPETTFDTAGEQPDLAELLRSLEPEQAEAVQPVLSVITRLAEEIAQLPEGDETVSAEKLVKEQALKEWCVRLLEHLDIKADDEAVRHFARLITGRESGEPRHETVPAPGSEDKGTHESKAADTLNRLGRLADGIKRKLHLLLWIGRHALRVAAGQPGQRLAISPASL